MRSVQRLLTVFAVFTLLFAGIAGTAIAQTEGGTEGSNTQQGGQVGGPAPTPKPPASTPKPPASTPKPPASTPKPPASTPKPTATPKPSQGGSNTVGGQQAPGTTPKPPSSTPNPNNASGSLWVLVDLSEQRVYVYKGNTLLRSSLVRTGKPGFETPTGTFSIQAKYRYKDMASCENGECWDTRDVPYSMLFASGGYYLHGAYWGSGWGYPASHGCVNLPVDFAGWLFGIAPNGTKVVVRW